MRRCPRMHQMSGPPPTVRDRTACGRAAGAPGHDCGAHHRSAAALRHGVTTHHTALHNLIRLDIAQSAAIATGTTLCARRHGRLRLSSSLHHQLCRTQGACCATSPTRNTPAMQTHRNASLGSVAMCQRLDTRPQVNATAPCSEPAGRRGASNLCTSTGRIEIK